MIFDWDSLEVDSILMITEDVTPDLVQYLTGEGHPLLVYHPPSPFPPPASAPAPTAWLSAVRVQTGSGRERSLWQAATSDGRLARRIPWRWGGRCHSSQGRPCGR